MSSVLNLELEELIMVIELGGVQFGLISKSNERASMISDHNYIAVS